jgi:hypothetical protein
MTPATTSSKYRHRRSPSASRRCFRTINHVFFLVSTSSVWVPCLST